MIYIYINTSIVFIAGASKQAPFFRRLLSAWLRL